MPVSLPSIRATEDHRTVTLGELRELVEASAHLPEYVVVRGNAVPFKMSDLGHPGGACLMSLALAWPEPTPE